MPPLRIFLSIVAFAVWLCAPAHKASADLVHTIPSAMDVAVTANGYTAGGSLDLTLGFAPTPGTNLTVVRNTGSAFIAGTTVIAIAAGDSHSLALCADGKLYGWGSNYYGELGNIGGSSGNVPVVLETGAALAGKTIIAIDAGVNSSYALTSDGKVFAWGINTYGQLGNGSTANSNTPVAVDVAGVLAGKVVTAVSAGHYHAMALTSDGQVVAWGLNDRGQLANPWIRAARSWPGASAAPANWATASHLPVPIRWLSAPPMCSRANRFP